MRIQSLGWEGPLGVANGNSLQYSCLENSMDRGTWRVTVQRVAKSQTQLATKYNRLQKNSSVSQCVVKEQVPFGKFTQQELARK